MLSISFDQLVFLKRIFQNPSNYGFSYKKNSFPFEINFYFCGQFCLKRRTPYKADGKIGYSFIKNIKYIA